ncbi:hypothetical protein [Paracoccus fistulariae]|uniref:Meckel syndrome type 1 protein n=1 Tax=Paracoccus fistulariae TaxID=658446 RepID=A0ABY7SN52_9RHOB|nr:hypothetical protein [Paracoccus fistulariae]MDB6180161.1 hypothetical protein [Paracoccus fistulariae]WCR08246.1 hypothetical protein JHX87_05375 [Paracoccus fistulariae]
MNKHAAPPEFAMSFTQEAVLLEKRHGAMWQPLGEAYFSGRDMASRLRALRDDAGATSDHPDTVLVIPDDQILYTTLTVPVGADTAAVVGRALEGMTPYKADELAFDWCPAENGEIETLRVAAVARRTLDEAETFARDQGFQPAGFVARPGDNRFQDDPDFGPSRLMQEQYTRPPFSEPDLSQARITAPVIADEALPATPTEPASAAQAVTVSRIVPHYVVAVAAPGAAVAAPLPGVEAAAETAAAAEAAPTAQEAAASGVIRHGAPRAPSTKGLSPRAQAVHDRARDAKAKRAEQPAGETAAEAPLLARLRNMKPDRLTLMVGGLAAAVLLILMLFGGQGTDDPVARTEDSAPPVEEVAATTPEQMPVDTVADGAEMPAQSPAEVQLAEQAQPVAPTDQGQAAEPGTDDAALPDASALTEAPAADAVSADPVTAENPAEDGPQQELATAATAPTAAIAERSLTGSRPLARPTQQSAAASAPAPETDAARAALGNDTLSRALNEAIAARDATREAEAQRRQAISAATMASDLANAPTSRPAANAQPTTAPRAVAPRGQRLASSARPPRATPARASLSATDRQPAVPANPQPYAERSRPQPASLSGNRPPERPSAARPAATPATAPAAAAPAASPEPATRPAAPTSARPPSRPDRQTFLEEGSASEDHAPTKLTADERRFLEGLLRDLRTAQAGATGLSEAERGAVIRLAEARPARRPVAVGATSERAVEDALAAALSESDRPSRRAGSAASEPAPVAATSTRPAQAGLGSSARPTARPGTRSVASGNDPGPGSASLSKAAVEDAIAAAVASSPSQPGAVPLTALTSSSLPRRRPAGETGDALANAVALAASASNTPTPTELRAAAEAQSQDALAEQRRADEELQRQAEARARQFAAADARREAEARAAAEARARAQAEAEARQRNYQPPEAESEPEVASANIPDGRTPTTAGSAATVKDGIQLNRTQIIGTIGAGRASRALVRLSNGRILTLRIGDKINGGTISAIGDSKITYVRGGQSQQLSVLGGR